MTRGHHHLLVWRNHWGSLLTTKHGWNLVPAPRRSALRLGHHRRNLFHLSDCSFFWWFLNHPSFTWVDLLLRAMAAVAAGQFSSIQRPSCSSSNPPSPPRAPHPTQATLSQTHSHPGEGCYHQLPAWRVQGDSDMDHRHHPRCLRSLLRINRSRLRRPPRHHRPFLRCLLCRTLSIVGGVAAEISRPHLPRSHHWGGFVSG